MTVMTTTITRAIAITTTIPVSSCNLMLFLTGLEISCSFRHIKAFQQTQIHFELWIERTVGKQSTEEFFLFGDFCPKDWFSFFSDDFWLSRMFSFLRYFGQKVSSNINSLNCFLMMFVWFGFPQNVLFHAWYCPGCAAKVNFLFLYECANNKQF